MKKRLVAAAVFALSAGACAPALQLTATSACMDVVTQQAPDCAPGALQPIAAQQQEPQKKAPPPGPGKKDFTTWMALLIMGFGALYLMAFK